MQTLRLWNTLGRKLTDMVPHQADGKVRIYHCGPTVYSSPHIGNMRRFLFADLLVRTLRFLGYDVWSVMNITDVGHLLDADHEAAGTDRMVLAAQREGATPEEIAAKYTQEFFEALTLLRAEPAQYYPRATMHIRQMIDVTGRLVDKGLAYETSSGVYLDVTKAPNYGALSGNTLDAVEAGARVDVREEKKHPADFALWIKAPKEHLMQWESPWGRGYPGWHIECSAMARQHLGDTLDIHTGGEDNIFPHHENEIAQSEGAFGAPFAYLWAHNAHLLVDGRKMAKSEGTYVTLRDIIARGYDPLAFRLLVLQTHYRSKLNFTWESLDAAAEGLRSLQDFFKSLHLARRQNEPTTTTEPTVDLQEAEKRFASALANDLGTPEALAEVFTVIRAFNSAVTANALPHATIDELIRVMNRVNRVLALFVEQEIPTSVQELLKKREDARKNKDFVQSDRLRDEIHQQGFDVEDTPAGPRLTPRRAA